MIGTVLWILIAVLAVAWEAACHFGKRPDWHPVERVLGSVAASLAGRLVLVLLWGWVGWHLFARYTIPR